MISNFKLANFKSIKEEANFDFKKLNLLIGPNNSGKSSVLLALAFLLQGKLINSSLKTNWVDLSNLREFAFKKNPRASFDFSISLLFTEEEMKRISGIMEGTSFSHFDFSKLTLKLKIPVERNERSGYIYYLSSMLFDGNDKAILGLNPLEDGEGKFASDELGEDVASVDHLRGFIPIVSGKASDNWVKFTDLVEDKLSNFFWLKTPRSVGEVLRREIAPQLPESVSSDGSRTLDVLTRIRDKEEYEEVWDKIKGWLSKFGLKDKIIPNLVSGNQYSLELRDGELDLRTNITRMGFGMNQLLPTVVQCFYTPLRNGARREEAMIFIEQPEIHLHPAMQAEVADLFIDASKMGKQLFIETHSEHLALRLQRRIAEGEISYQDVGIFYFEKDEEGTHVKKVELDETGRFKEKEPFPGFFEVGFDDAIRQTEAIMRQTKGKTTSEG